MKYNPGIHHRKSIRLKGYDYSQTGLYFITICCQNRACLFGEIPVGADLRVCPAPKTILNDAGIMIESEWLKLPERFINIELHEYIVMPNHFHAILQIVGAALVVAQNDTVAQNDMIDATEKGQPQGIAPTIAPIIAPTGKTVGDMVGAFKSITTVEYIRGVKNDDWQRFDGKLWQRNYWEHIIRNQNEYQRISEYIINNPINWNLDKLNGGDGNMVMESPAEYNDEIWMI